MTAAPGAVCPGCGTALGGEAPAADAAAGPGTPPQGSAPPPPQGANAPPQGSVAPPPQPWAAGGLPVSDKSARDISVAAHLSALIAVVGLPSPIGPLVVWLAKRESHPFIDDQGKEALNFNLSAFLYALGIAVVGFIFSFVTLGIGLFLFIPVFLAVMVAWLVLVIMGAVRASNGEAYRYPLTIRFVA